MVNINSCFKNVQVPQNLFVNITYVYTVAYSCISKAWGVQDSKIHHFLEVLVIHVL